MRLRLADVTALVTVDTPLVTPTATGSPNPASQEGGRPAWVKAQAEWQGSTLSSPLLVTMRSNAPRARIMWHPPKQKTAMSRVVDLRGGRGRLQIPSAIRHMFVSDDGRLVVCSANQAAGGAGARCMFIHDPEACFTTLEAALTAGVRLSGSSDTGLLIRGNALQIRHSSRVQDSGKTCAHR